MLPKPLETSPMTADWVSFRQPGVARIFSGRVELGQGISSTLIRIAAAELSLEEGQIELVAGNTGHVPNEGPTVGSLSVEVGGMAMRHAASAARWECLSRAATLLQASARDLDIENGMVLKDGSDTGLSYWSLTGDEDLSGRVADFADPIAGSGNAKRPSSSRRANLLERLRGNVFIHDLTFPDMLHGRMIHPPFGATGIASSPADVAVPPGKGLNLFRNGSLVGVVSRDEHDAARAAERLRAKLQWHQPKGVETDGPAKADVRSETVLESGPLPEGKPTSLVSLARPCLAHASIGSCCAVALYEDQSLTVWTHSQGVFALRDGLARVVGLKPENVSVQHVPGAGCYGHNGADDVALDAALLAREHAGQHMRVIWARSDEFQTGPMSPAMTTLARGWLSEDGAIEGVEVSVESPAHSTRPQGANAPNLRAATFMSDPIDLSPAIDPPKAAGGGSDRNATPIYRADRMLVTKQLVVDPPYRPSAFRGLGAQVNIGVIEGLMDELAGHAGLDPVAFRLANLQDPRAKAVIEAVHDMAALTGGEDAAARGIGFGRYKNSSGYCACIAEVLIDEDIRVTNIWAAIDVGEVLDDSGVRNQIEGGIVQALSVALCEEVKFEDGANVTFGWDDYPILGFDRIPDIEITILDRGDEHPLGCGEIAIGPTTAALLNAVTAGLGTRPGALPLTRENLIKMLSE